MDIGVWVGTGFSISALLAWLWLTFFRGRFWTTDQRLDTGVALEERAWPKVVVVIPARDEADLIVETITSVLGQRYPGTMPVYLVDDRSSDGTADEAREAARMVKECPPLHVVTARERPDGWAGKVWALHRGVEAASGEEHKYFWFTDADIVHSPDVLTGLVARAEGEKVDMVSVMARLQVSTFWDRLLIPAFVFFFGKLYPFRWVNDHGRETAAAAGGCVLVRKDRFIKAGGLAAMKGAIIDDCALAKQVRGPRGEGRLWLGMSTEVRSIRPYDGLRGIWEMVARTAFVQLRRSPVVLAGTVLGMVWLYLVSPAAAGAGIGMLTVGAGGAASWVLLGTGLAGWGLMAAVYLPMLRWYGLWNCWAVLLPVSGLLYTLMTVDSAWRSRRGRGGGWKGRTY